MKYFIVHVGGNQTAKQLSIELGCQIIVDFSWAETLNKIFTKRSSYPLHLGAVLVLVLATSLYSVENNTPF